MKEIKIIKNRSDIGAGTRGSDLGVDAIEIAAINAGSDFFNQHEYVDVPSSNEAVYEKQNTPYALRIGKVREVCENLCGYVMLFKRTAEPAVGSVTTSAPQNVVE